MSLRVAIIGAGDMGRAHAKAWAGRDEARVASVFDPDMGRAAALASAYGLTASASAADAIAAADVVSVCTPVCFHRAITCRAAEAGRHVLVEKPIALTVDDAETMMAAARRCGVRLAVAYQYRAFGRYRVYRDLIRQGRLGAPVYARFVDVREVRPKLAMHRRTMNGGPVIDMAGHFFDLMRFLTGAEPVSVFARGAVFGTDKQRLKGLADLAVDVAEIIVDHSGGHVLSVQVNWGMPEGFPARTAERIQGPLGLAEPQRERLRLATAEGVQERDVPPDPQGPAARIADLLSAIRGNSEPEVGGLEGLLALRVSLAALASIETGRAVAL